MISICIFTWGFTSNTHTGAPSRLLWIDFNLYFYVRIHKTKANECLALMVVNWFQFVFLREDSQDNMGTLCWDRCCELISICIFTWGFTRQYIGQYIGDLLWIDFNLYFYVRIHKASIKLNIIKIVVNWFQFVFLREDSQANWLFFKNGLRCELISICIFTWGFTRTNFKFMNEIRLWIDFNLYFYVRIHKRRYRLVPHLTVVNWFQFVFLREDSQANLGSFLGWFSCELISICIFTWGFTRLCR